MAEIKMTNAKALEFVLANYELPEDVRTKVENIKASIEKKNASSGSGKPTAKQIENEGYMAQIVDCLANSPEPMTIKQICQAIGIDSNQKVSALVTLLKKSGKVVRNEVKKVAYFTVATE